MFQSLNFYSKIFYLSFIFSTFVTYLCCRFNHHLSFLFQMIHRLIRKLLMTIVLIGVIGLRVFASATDPSEVSSGLQRTDSSVSENATEQQSSEDNGKFNPAEMIMGHIMDSHEWHFFTLTRSDGTEIHGSICLPVIIYTPGEWMSIFSFHKLHHPQTYKGFELSSDEKIVRTDGKKFYDFSITKDVLQLMISFVLMLIIFISVARNYAKYGIKAPRGLQSAVEVVVLFVRDEIAKPMLGRHYKKYLYFLLTLFFFIWINNVIGLIPGAANVTGNIAVTMTLAAITFILMMVSSRR